MEVDGVAEALAVAEPAAVNLICWMVAFDTFGTGVGNAEGDDVEDALEGDLADGRPSLSG